MRYGDSSDDTIYQIISNVTILEAYHSDIAIITAAMNLISRTTLVTCVISNRPR